VSVLLLLAILCGAVGFVVHALWFVAIVVVAVWLIGSVVRDPKGSRWYGW
jgi:type IV secretory pathway TrbD component